jgi:hypothetical protein
VNHALIVQNLGDDESGGRRSIYAAHACTVLSVDLVTGTGEPFTGEESRPAKQTDDPSGSSWTGTATRSS